MSADHAPWTVVIRDTYGQIQGTGFLVAPHLVCTCAHVITDSLGIERGEIRKPDASVSVMLISTREERRGKAQSWLPSQESTYSLSPEERSQFGVDPNYQAPSRTTGLDFTVLELDHPFENAPKAPLLSTRNITEHGYRVLGFPQHADSGEWSQGIIQSPDATGRIQLNTGPQERPITPGYSGAAVWDKDAGGIVGMIVESDHQLVAKMIAAHQIIDLIRLSTDTAYGASEPARNPIRFAGETHHRRGSLARAIRLDWFAARRQFFEGPSDFINETEGWRALVQWLRQFESTDEDEAEALRELIDHKLRSNIRADFKVFFLLAWLDPDGIPVWRGRPVSYEYLCEVMLPEPPTQHVDSSPDENFAHIEAHLATSLLEFDRLVTRIWLDGSHFWEALSQFSGFKDARRHYYAWRTSVRQWNDWWNANWYRIASRDKILTATGRRILVEAILFNVAMPATQDERVVRTLRLTAYAFPSPEPGIVPWFDEHISYTSQAKQGPWWLGITVLSRYAWDEAISTPRNQWRAFVRGAAWTGLHAAALFIGLVLAGLFMAMTLGGSPGTVLGWAVTATVVAAVTALITVATTVAKTGSYYQPPFNDPARWAASMRDKPGRTAAKLGVGALMALFFQIPVLGFIAAVASGYIVAGTASPWTDDLPTRLRNLCIRYIAQLREELLDTRATAT